MDGEYPVGLAVDHPDRDRVHGLLDVVREDAESEGEQTPPAR